MSFAAGIGAGIACGICCGLAAGQRRARARIEEHLEALLDSGQFQLLDSDGSSFPVGPLLDDALAAQPSEKTTILVMVVILGILAALGVIALPLLAR